MVRNEYRFTFKELGTSLLRTALVPVPAGFCCRDSSPFLSVEGLLTKHYGSERLSSMSFRDYEHLRVQEFSCVALHLGRSVSAGEPT